MITNPVFRNFESADVLDARSNSNTPVMTLSGITNKSLLLMVAATVVAVITSSRCTPWINTHHGHAAYIAVKSFFSIPFFAGIALVAATLWRKQIAPITAPLFAISEGVAIGIVSAVIDELHPGVTLELVGMTVAMYACVLIAYGIGKLTVASELKQKVFAAVCGAIAYCAGTALLAFAGVRNLPIATAGVSGFFVSLAIIAMPATALIATCDAALQYARERYPKYMEWYAALGIVASLVWIYWEMIGMFLDKQRRAA